MDDIQFQLIIYDLADEYGVDTEEDLQNFTDHIMDLVFFACCDLANDDGWELKRG